MIVVIPFCNKDAKLHIQNLELCTILDHRTDYTCLLSYEEGTDVSYIDSIENLAGNYFQTVRQFKYPKAPRPTWPAGPNWAFRNTAYHIHDVYPHTGGFLWWEADATPLKPGWIKQIETAYAKGGKPFMGYVVPTMGHMTGVGMYPSEIKKFLNHSIAQHDLAWDVAMTREVAPHLCPVRGLFQHVWTVDPNGKQSNDNKFAPATFESVEDVLSRVDFEMALFHRCKDGSLARRLKEHYNKGRHMDSDYTTRVERTTPTEVKHISGFDVKILIVTYKRDLPWLRYNLRCIEKFCHGFSGVVVVVPTTDEKDTNAIAAMHKNVEVKTFEEEPRKGFLHHMVMKCRADELVDADYILTMDADCQFHTHTTPEDYFSDGKPHYVVRTYNSLTKGKVSDCLQWKKVVNANIGFNSKWYTMCRHPTIWPRKLFIQFRSYVSDLHKMPFDKYVLSCRNEFPQTFAEFPSMGSWAMRHAPGEFFWVDASHGLAPADRMQNYWSRGGVSQSIPRGENMTAAKEIEGFLAK